MRLAQSDLGNRVLDALSRGEETKPPFRIENDSFVVELERAEGTLTVTDKVTGVVHAGLNRFVDGGDAGDEYNYSPPANDALFEAKVVSVKAFRDRPVPSMEIAYEARPRGDRCRPAEPLVEAGHHPRREPGLAAPGRGSHRRAHRGGQHGPGPQASGALRRPDRRGRGATTTATSRWSAARSVCPRRAMTGWRIPARRRPSALHRHLRRAGRPDHREPGLPEVEVLPGAVGGTTEIALTLLRCVGWLSRDDMPVRQGHAGPAYETPGAQVPGRRSFDYSIIPHEGHWSQARDAAYAFQASLRAVERRSMPASSCSGSFISTSPGEFIVSAVKETEDGNGLARARPQQLIRADHAPGEAAAPVHPRRTGQPGRGRVGALEVRPGRVGDRPGGWSRDRHGEVQDGSAG